MGKKEEVVVRKITEQEYEKCAVRRRELAKAADEIMGSERPERVKMIRMRHIRAEMQLMLMGLDRVVAEKLEEIGIVEPGTLIAEEPMLFNVTDDLVKRVQIAMLPLGAPEETIRLVLTAVNDLYWSARLVYPCGDCGNKNGHEQNEPCPARDEAYW